MTIRSRKDFRTHQAVSGINSADFAGSREGGRQNAEGSRQKAVSSGHGLADTVVRTAFCLPTSAFCPNLPAQPR